MPIDKLDVGDEGKVAERDFGLEVRQARERKRLSIVLDSYEGREFVWNILKWCKIFSVAPLEEDEMRQFEGRRDVGLFIWDKCFTSNSDAYNLAEREAHKRDLEEKRG